MALSKIQSNSLDEYEEGTWTPEFADATTGGNVSSTSADSGSATYVKIGALVYITCRFSNISTSGLTSTDAAYIRNLPYVSNAEAIGSMWRQEVTTSTPVAPRNISGTAYIRFERLRDNDTDVTLTVAKFAHNLADVIVSMSYTTDA
jgi:hypothetical protein